MGQIMEGLESQTEEFGFHGGKIEGERDCCMLFVESWPCDRPALENL